MRRLSGVRISGNNMMKRLWASAIGPNVYIERGRKCTTGDVSNSIVMAGAVIGRKTRSPTVSSVQNGGGDGAVKPM